MESREHGPLPRAVGSISRLPIMPRASRDNSRRAASPSKDDSLRSNLPRLSSRYGSTKIVPPKPLGESINRSIADQSLRNRNRSPVRDALQAAQAAALETTPPSSTNYVPVFDDGDENPIRPEKLPQKRRPRPSLTERTLETLAQIPPSPPPTRRRGSTVSNGRMGPPARPASSLRGSRPATPSAARPSSPTKQPFKPPGPKPPTKAAALPAVPSPGSLFSPPRAFVKGGSLRPAKTVSKDQESVSTTMRTPTNYSAKTMRAKASAQDSAHQRLVSLFKDPVKSSAPPDCLAVGVSSGGSGLLKPRLKGENTSVFLSAKDRTQRNKANSSKLIAAAVDASSDTCSAQSPPKTSLALRETIATAKAARKEAASAIRALGGNGNLPLQVEGSVADAGILGGSNEGVLKQRVKAATISGHLNISAMRLSTMPDAVLRMYDSGDSPVDWSEMVDLSRLNVADNEFETISGQVFPDWSVDEIADDEEKSNQFGGLEVLDLHNNLLQEVPSGLRRLGRLTRLDLSGNKLSNASLDLIYQIPGLQELNLSRNAFSGTLHLTQGVLQRLCVLNLRENKIEAVDIDDVESGLRTLDLSENRLRQLPWQTLARLPLVTLDVSGNKLDGIGFEGADAGFTQLRECDLSSNAFSSLARGISRCTCMQICRLSNNRLTELPDLGGWHSLVTLQVSGNQLSELPHGLAELEQLRNVDVSHNNIKSLNPSIATITSLVSIELTGNPLREPRFLTMATTDLKNELQTRLVVDDEQESTSSTRSTRVLDGMTSTQDIGYRTLFRPLNGTLDLASKALTKIDLSSIDLESASPPIHTLRLSNNELTSLPIELLSHPALKWSLRSLDISHNPQLHPTEYLIEDLFLPVLRSLYVVSTGLTSLDGLTAHLNAPELTELNISCHRLAGHVPWVRAWFPSCTSLLASDNWFTSIDVEAARGLEVLDIRNNYIEEIPRGIGLLGNHVRKVEAARLRVFECGGNSFRVPRINVIEKGTEAVLKDLRRMVAAEDVPDEWKDEI